MDQVWVLPHAGGKVLTPREAPTLPRWCYTDMETNLLFGILPKACAGKSLRYRWGVAKHTVSALHTRISLLNEGAEMQEVLLSVSFNHRRKKIYGFVTLVYHTKTVPPSSVLQYPQAHPGGFGSRAALKADDGFCRPVLFCN